MLCLTSISFYILVLVSFLVCCAAFDVNEDVEFELYTRDNRQIFQVFAKHGEVTIESTRFDPSRPTRIFVHGYQGKRRRISQYAEAYLNTIDCNFIAINWIKGASTVNYYTAKGRVKDVCYHFRLILFSNSKENIFHNFIRSLGCFQLLSTHLLIMECI